MRTRMIAVAVAGVILLVGAMLTAQEKAEPKWLDVENCYFCQPLGNPPGMLQNVDWENFKLANGILSVVTVKPGFEEPYAKAEEEIEARCKAYDPANPQPMCGMCQAKMAAMDATVKMEEFKTRHGGIGLTTSTNPETVAKLHAIVDRSVQERAAWEKAEMEKPEAEKAVKEKAKEEADKAIKEKAKVKEPKADQE